MRRLSFLVIVTCGIFASACGGDSTNGGSDGGPGSSDGPASGISAAEACTDLANTFCTRLNVCAPLLVQIVYGDVSTCEARFQLGCPESLGDVGTTNTPARVEACALEAMQLSCDDSFRRNAPSNCRPIPGALATGMACGDDGQCATGYCKKQSNGCGQCAARAAENASCSVLDDCDFGLTCTNNKCLGLIAMGGNCGTTHPCLPELACRNGTCGMPIMLGQACDPANDACDRLQGQYCKPGLPSSTCAQATLNPAGSSCGATLTGVTGCQGGATCSASGIGQTGSCIAPSADDASCDSAAHKNCLTPSTCVSGVCRRPDPQSCH